MKKIIYTFPFLVIAATSCSPSFRIPDGNNERITINFVQVNDVYEIAPMAEGKIGGLARVAAIKKKYLSKNPNTFLLMTGDFLSPSVFNSLKINGKAVRGKQMIETMNAAGVDLAIFGNHEFDIKESELQERINESDFQWISSNTFHKQKAGIVPFVKINAVGTASFPVTYIRKITDADGTTAKIGFFAITLPFNQANYVSYTDPLTTAKQLYDQLKDSTDAVIALTHQSLEDDEKLAREIPGLAMILGGHEHDQQYVKIGKVPITKSMANARSVFVTRLMINKKDHTRKIRTTLHQIDDSIISDSTTEAIVDKWVKLADKNYASLGFDSKKIVFNEGASMDGRESTVRSQPTDLTRLITAAMAFAAPKSDVSILNAGSIRVDDFLQMPVTQYDIIRTLPFGGGIREVDMRGSVLLKIFQAGVRNKGTGGYLHYNDAVTFDLNAAIWKIKDSFIDPSRIYRVALSDFLLTGAESNLSFLTPANPDIVKVYDTENLSSDPRSDIRKAVIDFAAKIQTGH